MRGSAGKKLLFATLFLFVLVALFAAERRSQDPSPSPSPSASPSASPSPSPRPTATPTPLPGAQNFHQWGSITVFNGLPSDSVRAIAQTNDGVMWFGTDNGLVRFDGRRVQNIPVGDAEVDRILALKVSVSDQLWVGTHAGAFVYSDNGFKLVQNTEKSAITAILFGTGPDRGIQYLGSEGGDVFRVFYDTSRSYTALRTKSVPALEDGQTAVTSLVEQNGTLLAATSGRGVFSVKGGGLNAVHTPPNPGVINALATGDGLLWLGTDATKGVSGIYRSTAGERFERVAAPTSKVLTLGANDSGLWAGTERYGLFHFVGSKLKKNYTFENTSGGLRSNTVYTLFTDREGVLWIGTNRGVSRFDRLGATQETVSAVPNSNFIRSLFRASDGTLYAGSNRGLFVKSGDDWKQLPAYGNHPIFAITENSSRKLLVDTEPVNRRSFSADGAIWHARDGGVVRERDGRSEKIFEAEDVRDIYVDGDRIWAATTTRGLLHARNDPRFGRLVSSIGFEQGMPSEKAFAILPFDERLLIGTNRGVVTYSLGSVAPKLIATRVLSQRVHELGELAEKIDLEYPQNSLLVEVAGQSSRTFPEEFQYAFVLTNGKGEEVARQLSNDPQYAPASLAPGDYTIESIAFNRDLLASEPLFIRFSVAKAPFPWTATALGVLLAIAVVGLVWAMVEHRRIAHRNRELAAARFDLANEAERERRRIARDLHDQTLADLRNLMLLSDKISPDKPEFRAEIESVSGEIRRICEDLSPSVLENVGLIAALEFLLERTIENSGFSADENLEDRIDLPMNAQLQVYRIAQEVLTNIKRHSTADRVDMSVSMSDEKGLQLVIEDNGTPFDSDAKNAAGRGIANIRARASLIKARANWSAGPENGNRFSLVIGS